MALQTSIIEILEKAQASTVHHPKLLKSLKSLHDETDLVEFFEAFIQPLGAALVIVKKLPAVERVLEFVAKFSASTAPLHSSPREDEESELSDRSTIYLHLSRRFTLLHILHVLTDNDGEEEGRGGCEKGRSDGEEEVKEEEEEEDEVQEHTFFNLLLAKLLSYHTASNRAVR